jgi:hypothetical protein
VPAGGLGGPLLQGEAEALDGGFGRLEMTALERDQRSRTDAGTPAPRPLQTFLSASDADVTERYLNAWLSTSAVGGSGPPLVGDCEGEDPRSYI